MHDTASQHPVEHLFRLLDTWSADDYPTDVEPTDERIPGVAFFPGGYGLWAVVPGQPLPAMPVGKVMALGHNFGPVDSYRESVKRGIERLNSSTWCQLIAFLRTCGIMLEDCFFTNAYMGLKADIDIRTGRVESTGPFAGAKDSRFVRRCQVFLEEQIRTQQPRLLLALGKDVWQVLAPLPPLEPLVPELKLWSGINSYPVLDESESSLLYPVKFEGVPHPTAVVALVHPSYRARNAKWRKYKGEEDDAAEIALVREGLSLSGLRPDASIGA